MLCLKEKFFFFKLNNQNPNTQWHQQNPSGSDDRFWIRAPRRDTGHLYWGTNLRFLTTKLAWLKSIEGNTSGVEISIAKQPGDPTDPS